CNIRILFAAVDDKFRSQWRFILGLKTGNTVKFTSSTFPVDSLRVAAHAYFQRRIDIHFQKFSNLAPSTIPEVAAVRGRVEQYIDSILEEHGANESEGIVEILPVPGLIRQSRELMSHGVGFQNCDVDSHLAQMFCECGGNGGLSRGGQTCDPN